jgi:hypothetical protein
MKLSFSRAARIHSLALAKSWKGLATCDQKNFTWPLRRLRTISTAWVPTLGFSVLAGSFQRPSHLSRCALLATTMSEGSRWAKVPTSRAVPHAEGWPVSEKAPEPGVDILPPSRWIM